MPQANEQSGLTAGERLLLSLGQHKGRMLEVIILVGEDGQPELVVTKDLGKSQRLKKEVGDTENLTSA